MECFHTSKTRLSLGRKLKTSKSKHLLYAHFQQLLKIFSILFIVAIFLLAQLIKDNGVYLSVHILRYASCLETCIVIQLAYKSSAQNSYQDLLSSSFWMVHTKARAPPMVLYLQNSLPYTLGLQIFLNSVNAEISFLATSVSCLINL